tara:strand:+ start:77 stop:232 length:156 start_codon:yes stop_codon:yes gene_type:complete
MKELKDKGLKLTNYYVCPICKEPTKPDEWSNDRYSCIDCGPIPNRERGIGT